MVKVALGIIAVVFVFFFGSSAIRNPQGGSEVAAKINGQTITEKMIEGRTRLALDSNPLYKNLPDNFSAQLRQMTLGTLIESALIDRETKKIGMVITPDEIGKIIRLNPSLTGESGAFDYNFYQNRFRPGHLNRYGVEYEEWVEENLRNGEFKELFEKGVVVTDEEVRQNYSQKNKQADLKEFEKVKEQEKEELQHELVNHFYSQWYRGAASRAKINIKEQ